MDTQLAPASMSQLIFDKYEIIRRLAVGGMGEIFLARQRTAGLDRLAILKSLLPDLAEQPDFIDQFLDEARVAATLNHPNIVSIYEVGAWNGIYFIAMEYIKGESLSGLLTAACKTGTMLPFPVLARIVHDAALGLDHAHMATDPEGRPLAIVHRDVTPQNIMVRTDGVTKVVDFGVARAANRVTRTATGLVKGKVPYMPPEQLSNKTLDGGTDQWGLGVSMWECLTGRRLFRRENDLATMREILHGEIRPPTALVRHVPPQLEAVVMRMLQRDREQRFPRLRDVATALQPYLDSVSEHSSEANVGGFVQTIAGNRIDDRVKDLTPSELENFVIALKSPSDEAVAAPATVVAKPHSSAPAASPTGVGGADVPTAPAPPRRRSMWLAAAAASLITGALVASAVGLRTRSGRSGEMAGAVPAAVDRRPRPEGAPVPKHGVTAPDERPPLLQITSTPDGAMVYSDGRLVGQTPLRLSALVAETDYQLVVEKAGHQPAILRVRLQQGEDKQLTVTLKKRARSAAAVLSPRSQGRQTETAAAPGPPQQEEGFLTVKTAPWTKVTIDGKPYGSTPLFKARLPAGSHTVAFANEQEGISETRKVRIEPGEVVKLDLQLKK